MLSQKCITFLPLNVEISQYFEVQDFSRTFNHKVSEILNLCLETLSIYPKVLQFVLQIGSGITNKQRFYGSNHLHYCSNYAFFETA